MRTARALCPTVALLALPFVAAVIPALAGAADPELSLPEAVRQALASNLDLITQRQALAAATDEPTPRASHAIFITA